MEIKQIKVKLDKKDYLRTLLTDTAPSDVPIVFSNDGFYINSHRFIRGGATDLDKAVEKLYRHIINPSDGSKKNSGSTPYKYKINKDEFSLRTLSLLHPRAQINFCEFYRDYSSAIIYLCSKSEISIRAPKKVGNTFYSYDEDVTNKYKEITIDTPENELHRRHSSSFFSYKGFDRIYKLFSSKIYIEMEKKFSIMCLLDVANCFGSIYTHTVAWAVKNKDYTKSTLKFENQISSKFDRLMQRCNNNETNGIAIGPEVSRVFSEVIFQEIDRITIKELETSYELYHGKHFRVFRYVDDYIVFAQSESVIRRV
jgi:hypothetical protein